MPTAKPRSSAFQTTYDGDFERCPEEARRWSMYCSLGVGSCSLPHDWRAEREYSPGCSTLESNFVLLPLDRPTLNGIRWLRTDEMMGETKTGAPGTGRGGSWACSLDAADGVSVRGCARERPLHASDGCRWTRRGRLGRGGHSSGCACVGPLASAPMPGSAVLVPHLFVSWSFAVRYATYLPQPLTFAFSLSRTFNAVIDT